jgi:transcriptional regulator with XRE-family HTH domain
MSQAVLAGLVGRTADWLQKAERNHIELDRISVLQALANALGVPLTHLLPGHVIGSGVSGPAVRALSAVLMDYRKITPSLTKASGSPPELDQLGRDVREVWDAYQASRYGHATAKLPIVLGNAHLAHRMSTGDSRLRALRLLALSYHAAAAVLTKLGEVQLAWISAERGLVLAQDADDTAVSGSLVRSVAHAMLSNGRYEEAVGLVEDVAPDLASRSAKLGEVSASIYGTLMLTGSIAAARCHDRKTASTFLSEAARAADRLGRDANHMWTAFGPTNVAVHRVATSMEFGDVETALQIGPQIDTAGLPIERRVRHSLEIARALTSRRRFDEALSRVLDAELLAPEHVRTHFLSRQLVTGWVLDQRRRPGTELVGLAHRLNVLH